MPDQSQRRPGTTKPKRILVVDDNVDVAESLQEVLEAAGHTATIATDAVKALELASTMRPDVAILDIELPIINGYELALHLRALPQLADCRLIALTGYGQAHGQGRSLDSGFQHHLVKPVDVEGLLTIIGE
jgi:CheY-like chemotaxis protein